MELSRVFQRALDYGLEGDSSSSNSSSSNNNNDYDGSSNSSRSNGINSRTSTSRTSSYVPPRPPLSGTSNSNRNTSTAPSSNISSNSNSTSSASGGMTAAYNGASAASASSSSAGSSSLEMEGLRREIYAHNTSSSNSTRGRGIAASSSSSHRNSDAVTSSGTGTGREGEDDHETPLLGEWSRQDGSRSREDAREEEEEKEGVPMEQYPHQYPYYSNQYQHQYQHQQHHPYHYPYQHPYQDSSSSSSMGEGGGLDHHQYQQQQQWFGEEGDREGEEEDDLMEYYYNYFHAQFGGSSSNHSISTNSTSTNTPTSSGGGGGNPLQLLLACSGRASGASVPAANEVDAFYGNLYGYFYHRGLYAVIIKEASSLLALAVTIALSTVLLFSINYADLSRCSSLYSSSSTSNSGSGTDTSTSSSGATTCHKYLYQYMHSPVSGSGYRDYSSLSSLLYRLIALIYMCLFAAYFVYKIRESYAAISSARAMEVFYRKVLGISNTDMYYVSWDDVVRRVKALHALSGWALFNPTSHTHTPTPTQYQHMHAMQQEQHPSSGASAAGGHHPTAPMSVPSGAPLLSELSIASRLMRRDNYLIALVNQGVLDLSLPDFVHDYVISPLRMVAGQYLPKHARKISKTGGSTYGLFLTRSLEESVVSCTLRYMHNVHSNVPSDYLRDVAGLQRRFVMSGLLQAAMAPFLLIYMCLQFLLEYVAAAKAQGNYLGPRSFSSAARWTFREYNELPHVFEARLAAADGPAESYLAIFSRGYALLLSRSAAFVSGALLSALLLLSLYDEDVLIYVHIGEHNLLWYIGILSGIYAASSAYGTNTATVGSSSSSSTSASTSANAAAKLTHRDHYSSTGIEAPEYRQYVRDSKGRLIRDPYGHMSLAAEAAMLRLAAHTHYLPDKYIGKAHTPQVRDDFARLYPYRIQLFLLEMLSVVTTPLLLVFTLPKNAAEILAFMQRHTVYVDGLGDVCDYSLFDIATLGDASGQYRSSTEPTMPDGHNNKAPAAGYAVGERGVDGKVEASFMSFRAQHPTWDFSTDSTAHAAAAAAAASGGSRSYNGDAYSDYHQNHGFLHHPSVGSTSTTTTDTASGRGGTMGLHPRGMMLNGDEELPDIGGGSVHYYAPPMQTEQINNGFDGYSDGYHADAHRDGGFLGNFVHAFGSDGNHRGAYQPMTGSGTNSFTHRSPMTGISSESMSFVNRRTGQIKVAEPSSFTLSQRGGASTRSASSSGASLQQNALSMQRVGTGVSDSINMAASMLRDIEQYKLGRMREAEDSIFASVFGAPTQHYAQEVGYGDTSNRTVDGVSAESKDSSAFAVSAPASAATLVTPPREEQGGNDDDAALSSPVPSSGPEMMRVQSEESTGTVATEESAMVGPSAAEEALEALERDEHQQTADSSMPPERSVAGNITQQNQPYFGREVSTETQQSTVISSTASLAAPASGQTSSRLNDFSRGGGNVSPSRVAGYSSANASVMMSSIIGSNLAAGASSSASARSLRSLLKHALESENVEYLDNDFYWLSKHRVEKFHRMAEQEFNEALQIDQEHRDAIASMASRSGASPSPPHTYSAQYAGLVGSMSPRRFNGLSLRRNPSANSVTSSGVYGSSGSMGDNSVVYGGIGTSGKFSSAEGSQHYGYISNAPPLNLRKPRSQRNLASAVAAEGSRYDSSSAPGSASALGYNQRMGDFSTETGTGAPTDNSSFGIPAGHAAPIPVPPRPGIQLRAMTGGRADVYNSGVAVVGGGGAAQNNSFFFATSPRASQSAATSSYLYSNNLSLFPGSPVANVRGSHGNNTFSRVPYGFNGSPPRAQSPTKAANTNSTGREPTSNSSNSNAPPIVNSAPPPNLSIAVDSTRSHERLSATDGSAERTSSEPVSPAFASV